MNGAEALPDHTEPNLLFAAEHPLLAWNRTGTSLISELTVAAGIAEP